eukprot:CAMPEP_0183573224 /NCGR_PEP_ID=MMETSP0371-20130417/130455_1 /TAXON_ID=268820 /ORGANISM="Peridinium aciculiferum, Strain PAER-2" /LENGTH=41 /DNA_ID= /DNA_START= /DNA_END= /DNA_ORIENTATION=
MGDRVPQVQEKRGRSVGMVLDPLHSRCVEHVDGVVVTLRVL